HATHAISKLTDFHIKSTAALDKDEALILNTIKTRSGHTAGEIYALYQQNGGAQAYSSFKRKIKRLEQNKFISTQQVNEGEPGRTTRLYYGTA
ncbi:hypothetical protein COU91_02910, partial [Candidatus Saccharibacteria bacterium CG10_big_fil_rev_8_21_14_0_10_47_8]